MRTVEDLIKVRITTYFIADLDWERIESDPNWKIVSQQFDLYDPKQRQQALFRYIAEYTAREQVLVNVSSTNGPSDLYITEMEVVGDGYSSSGKGGEDREEGDSSSS